MQIVKTNTILKPNTNNVYYESDIMTDEASLPTWWEYDKHALKESVGIGGAKTFVKYCIEHDVDIADNGCYLCNKNK